MAWKVQVAVYDLSMGIAKQVSQAILGIHVEGIWHTGVIVYGKETFFGGGIVSLDHQEFIQSYQMQPVQLLDMGETEIPEEIFQDFIREISPRFTSETYDLINNNCNHCANEIVNFLVGAGIPDHIVDLPSHVFNSPGGQLFRPMFEQMQTGMRGGMIPGFQGYEQQPQAMMPNPYSTPSYPSMAPPPQSYAPIPAPFAVPPPRPPAPPVPPAPLESFSPPEKKDLKPLLSIDPPGTLSKMVSTAGTRLREIAEEVSKSKSEGSGFFPPADEATLTQTISSVVDSTNGSAAPPEVFSFLTRTLGGGDWPSKAEFWSLIILRPLILKPSTFSALKGEGGAQVSALLDLVLSRVASGFASKPAQLMGLCVLTNLFSHSDGVAFLKGGEREETLTSVCLDALQQAGAKVEVRQMAAALLYNLSLHHKIEEGSEDIPDTLVEVLVGVLDGIDAEKDETTIVRRLYVAERIINTCGKAGAELFGNAGFDAPVRALSAKTTAVRGPARDLLGRVGAFKV